MKQHYGFLEFDLKATNEQTKMILQSTRNDKQFEEFGSDLDLSNIRLFKLPNGAFLAVFQSLTNETFYSVKGNFINSQFIIDDRIFVEKNTSDGNRSTLIIAKNDEAIRVDLFKDGSEVFTISDNVSMLKLSDLKNFPTLLSQNLGSRDLNFTDSNGNHGGNGFCQRERGESFAKCYKAEKDEFCDDLISCIAVDTVPAISILIAAACSCYA